MKIPGGYILQPRCFDASDAAHLPPVTREVWFYLLRHVNHKDNGKFKRGQGFISVPAIQKALEWYVGCCPKQYSKTQVTKALRRLHEDAMIDTTKTTRGSLATVLNYAHYQDPKSYEDTHEDSTKTLRRSNGDHTINKNVKKKNERSKEKIPPSIEEVEAYCQERNNGINPQHFFDYQEARGWRLKSGPIKSWKACIRTWERNNFHKGSQSDGTGGLQNVMDMKYAD